MKGFQTKGEAVRTIAAVFQVIIGLCVLYLTAKQIGWL